MKAIGDVLRDTGWNEKLAELAKRVERNVPDRREPEAFHAEKSDIVHELERLAQEARA